MSDWPLLRLISKSRRSCLKWAQVELNCSICQGATIQSWSFSEKWQKLILTGVTQLLELDQENSIYSIYFCNIVLILYRYEKICIKMYLLVEFSSFSSLQFTTFVFQFTIWKKRSSNLKMSINFGRVLYLKELSYHTQIGRIWKSKTNSLKWDQSGYCSFIRLDFTVFQRWVNFMVIF